MTGIPAQWWTKCLDALLQMKEQVTLDQASAISTMLEHFFACVHNCDHKVIDFCHISHTQLTLLKEGNDQQDELKALHKLICFLVVHQCKVIRDFSPFFDNKASVVRRMMPVPMATVLDKPKFFWNQTKSVVPC